MAYKFQIGAFSASGSIKAETELDAASTFKIGGTTVAATANELNIMDGDTSATATTIVDADRLVLNDGGSMVQVAVTDLRNYMDDAITAMPELASIGKAGATTNIVAGDLTMYNAVNDGNPSISLGATAAERFSIASIYDSSAQTLDKVVFETKAASGTADKGMMEFKIDEALVAKIDDGGVDVVGALSASTDIIGHHAKARQLSLAYDGAGGAEGHIKLGAGGDMQMAVFSDNATILNNTNAKDIVFQVKGASGSSVQPLKVIGADHTVRINKLNLSGTAVTALGADLNLLAGAAAAGGVDWGTNYLRTGGLLYLDIDVATAPDASNSVVDQAGSLTLGAGKDAGIAVNGDHLYIENKVDTKNIIFRNQVGDGGTDMQMSFAVGGEGALVPDDKKLVFGTDDDYVMYYNEASADSLILSANVEGAAFKFEWRSDEGDDALDKWEWEIANQGVMTLSNFADGDYGDAFATFTPNAVALKQTASFGGSMTVASNLTVSGDLLVTGDVTTVNTTNMLVKDSLIGLNEGASSNANDCGFIIERGSTGNNAAFIWDESADKFTMGLTTAVPSATGNLTVAAGTLVVGTLEGDVTGDLTGTADLATSVNVTANNSANETVYPVFVDGATGTQGLESDTGLSYNPSTGVLTAESFSGTFSGASTETLIGEKTGNYTWDKAHGTILRCDSASGGFTITLPAANASGYTGLVLKVKKTSSDSNAVVIHRAGSDTIDGAHAIVLESPHAAVSIFSDGTEWFVM